MLIVLTNYPAMPKFTDDMTNRRASVPHRTYEAVVIGVSSGGVEALSMILPRLTADFACAVIVVQHVHPHSKNFLVTHLQARCRIPVKEAEEKEAIQSGRIYLAPPNYHLLVEQSKTFSLSSGQRENYARPAIDVLFETAAEVYQHKLIGVILTGANRDGSKGLQTIQQCGGVTVVQHPATAKVAAMPCAAIELTAVDYVLPLSEIGDLLNRLSARA